MPLLTAFHYTWSAARRNAFSILLPHQKSHLIWLLVSAAKTAVYSTYSCHYTLLSPSAMDAGWHHICPTKMDVRLEAVGCIYHHQVQLSHQLSLDLYRPFDSLLKMPCWYLVRNLTIIHFPSSAISPSFFHLHSEAASFRIFLFLIIIDQLVCASQSRWSM